jgi:serralysin
VTVDFATADGTAKAASDYEAAVGTVTFAPNETTKTITININGDPTVEFDEDFVVNLSNALGATIAVAQGQGTITNDDIATLSISDATVAEGNAGTTVLTFAVTLSGTADVPISVDFSTANGTATTSDNDYAAASGTLSWAAGATSPAMISVTINGDTNVEPDETLFVNLTNPVNATLSKSQGVGTIQNDDLHQTYPGTTGNDLFQVIAGSTPGSWTFKLNGTELAVDPQALSLVLDGLGGNDSLTVTGSSGDDTFEVWPDRLKLGNLTIGMANIETISLEGGNGSDSVVIHDSPGNDNFQAGPGWAKMDAAGVAIAANSVEKVQANSTSGSDTAYFYDSAAGGSVVRSTTFIVAGEIPS